MSDDDFMTEDELRAMGIDPADAIDVMAMPVRWDKFTAAELAGFSRCTVEAAEELFRDGVPIPSGLRVDLIQMCGVEAAPHEYRMRAARLLAATTN